MLPGSCWKHIKRGTNYCILHHGNVYQTHLMIDMSCVIVCQENATGKIVVYPHDYFLSPEEYTGLFYATLQCDAVSEAEDCVVYEADSPNLEKWVRPTKEFRERFISQENKTT